MRRALLLPLGAIGDRFRRVRMVTRLAQQRVRVAALVVRREPVDRRDHAPGEEPLPDSFGIQPGQVGVGNLREMLSAAGLMRAGSMRLLLNGAPSVTT